MGLLLVSKKSDFRSNNLGSIDLSGYINLDTDVSTYLSALSSEVTFSEKVAVNGMVKNLKTVGIFDKLTGLYPVCSSLTLDDSIINIKEDQSLIFKSGTPALLENGLKFSNGNYLKTTIPVGSPSTIAVGFSNLQTTNQVLIGADTYFGGVKSQFLQYLTSGTSYRLWNITPALSVPLANLGLSELEDGIYSMALNGANNNWMMNEMLIGSNSVGLPANTTSPLCTFNFSSYRIYASGNTTLSEAEITSGNAVCGVIAFGEYLTSIEQRILNKVLKKYMVDLGRII